MTAYHKIPNVGERDHETRKIMFHGGEVVYSSDDLAGLKNIDWIFTEKIDGTNVRVICDCGVWSVFGRTDNAQLRPELLKAIHTWTKTPKVEEFAETVRGRNQRCIIYGEGVGPKIQKNLMFKQGYQFIPFDVRFETPDAESGEIRSIWLKPDSVLFFAHSLGLDAAPIVLQGPLWAGIAYVQKGLRSRFDPENKLYAEGVIGRPVEGYLTRTGNRIICKIKHRDFFEID